jgi:hypothetical protein
VNAPHWVWVVAGVVLILLAAILALQLARAV